jgi:glycosyltransferase involved in cell wall biosynthesis
VPIIASAVGGVPEIISGPELGVLVEPPVRAEAVAAALAGLLDSASMRRRLAANARQAYLSQFTATPWVQRMRAVYDDVLRERADHRSAGRLVRGLATR